MQKICACNHCPYGPGEDDPASEKPRGLNTPDTFCGIAEQDTDGAFVAAYRPPVYLPEGEECKQVLLFKEAMARRLTQAMAA